MKQQFRCGWFSTLLTTTWTVTFATAAALAGDVSSDLHRRCKGAQDYAGCIRVHTHNQERSGSSNNRSDKFSDQVKRKLDSQRSPVRPANSRPTFDSPAGSRKHQPAVNIRNEKNIRSEKKTIINNETNVMRGKPKRAKDNETQGSKKANEQNRRSSKPDKSRLRAERAERSGESGPRSSNREQKRRDSQR